MVGVNASFTDITATYTALKLLPFIIVCALGCTPLPKKVFEKLESRFPWISALSPLFTAILFLVCIAYMVDNSFSPFLYYIF
jgi:hypothetical protein